jgi:hypothetical protein
LRPFFSSMAFLRHRSKLKPPLAGSSIDPAILRTENESRSRFHRITRTDPGFRRRGGWRGRREPAAWPAVDGRGRESSLSPLRERESREEKE